MTRTFITLSLVLFFLLTITSVSAVIEVEKVGLVDEAEVGGNAVFQLTIHNKGTERDVFKIIPDPFDVSPFSKFAEDIIIDPPQVKIDPGDNEVITVTVHVAQTATPDEEYTIDLTVTSLVNTDIHEIIQLFTKVLAPKNVVQIITDVPDHIVPGEDITLRITFKNRLNIPLPDHIVEVDSEIQGIGQRFSIDLGPKEEQEKTVTFQVDRDITPGDYGFDISVIKNGDVKGLYRTAFTLSKNPVIEEKTEEVSSFLKKKIIITKSNVGNTEVDHNIEVETSLLRRIFTTTRPNADYQSGKLTWELTLEPKEEVTVELTYNYRSIFYGLIIIIMVTLVLLFHVERSAIIKKKIFKVREKDGVSELKILVHLRNGKKAPISDVMVVDIIPNFAKLLEEYGTLKPDKVQKGMKSVRMVWELGTLDPKEERVLSYKIKTKLKIIESILPAVRMNFKQNRRYQTIKSAKVTFKSHPTAEEQEF